MFGEVEPVARELARRLDARLTLHGRFGTAVIAGAAARIDLATARTESYPAPGALPEVRPGTPDEDLVRRDFTVNAIAVGLDGARQATLRSVPHALEDLAARRLRVLHDASFTDDPTRLLRLARYGARLEFAVEAHTAALAERALATGALGTVSGARLGAELRLALDEPDPLASLSGLARLGILRALHPRLRFQEALLRAALALLPEQGGRRDLLVLAGVALPLSLGAGPAPGAELRLWLDRLEFPAADRDRVVSIAAETPRLVDALPTAQRPSELRAAVGRAPPEAVALAGALGPAEPARRWLGELSDVALEITGDDLLAAGIAPGPELGRRLRDTLDRRLDGELPPGAEAELRAALEAHPGAAGGEKG